MSESPQQPGTRGNSPRPAHHNHFLENLLEKTLFSSRWLLAPIYLGLAFSLLLILFKFAQKSWAMALKVVSISSDDTIIGILSLVDLSLMGNLLLMIMFGGYQNFVSQLDLDGHKDKPDWIGHVGFGDLKLKLMASIVAISAIDLLKNFMNVEQVPNRDLAWSVGIHLTFVASAVLLAVMDLLMARTRK
jgi:uncharacterized protein (TIGR00645 family)